MVLNLRVGLLAKRFPGAKVILLVVGVLGMMEMPPAGETAPVLLFVLFML